MAKSYTENHFGKTLDEGINADDLIAYFAEEQEESLTLEFKSYHNDKQKLDAVLRTIAAFLNAEGGLLVFGAPPEVRKNGKYKVVKGYPTSIPTGFTTKDSLVRSISDNISYMPIGIRVMPVEMPDERFVYLIEVQESPNKPHQFDKEYPIRLDGQSVGAPHYLVEALFKQTKTPQLSGTLMFLPQGYTSDDRQQWLNFEISIHLYNSTKFSPEFDVYYHIDIPGAQFYHPAGYTPQPGPIFRDQVVNMLPHGPNIKKKETCRVLLSALQSKIFPKSPDYYESMIKVNFLFGGRSAAVKKSYTINFSYRVNVISRHIIHIDIEQAKEFEEGN